MGFKENLKAELSYSGIRVKELAELSGLKKQTVDSYLREKSYTPSVEAAVRIAAALGVSVEYLVTGKETKKEKHTECTEPELRALTQALGQLNTGDRKIIIKNALALIDLLKSRKKNPSR